MSDQKRVNLHLPTRTVERLEALKQMTDATSTTEVIRHALMTYESIVNHLAGGVTFKAVKTSGEVLEVEFLIDATPTQEDTP